VRRQPRLVQEHLDEALLLGEVRQDALDGDALLEALDAGALGDEDLGHAARGEAFEHAVPLLLWTSLIGTAGNRPEGAFRVENPRARAPAFRRGATVAPPWHLGTFTAWSRGSPTIAAFRGRHAT
jgi:hypothetical protein